MRDRPDDELPPGIRPLCPGGPRAFQALMALCDVWECDLACGRTFAGPDTERRARHALDELCLGVNELVNAVNEALGFPVKCKKRRSPRV